MALTGITAASHRVKWGQQERSDAIGGRAVGDERGDVADEPVPVRL
jgi:hypothetical protein